jgi:hypothetical protein
VCGFELTPAGTHTPSDWIVDVPATADTDGSMYKECTVCGCVLETGTIPATGGDLSSDDDTESDDRIVTIAVILAFVALFLALMIGHFGARKK